MAKVEDRERWSDTEVLNVPQVNAELRETVAEMNGRIDRENLPSLNTAKFHVGTFNEPLVVSGASATISNVSTSQSWSEIDAGSLLCADGRVEVEAVASVTDNLARGWYSLGVMIDGRLVARTPSSDIQDRMSLRCFACPPVAQGVRRISLVAQAAPGSPVATLTTLNVGNYLLFARSVVR